MRVIALLAFVGIAFAQSSTSARSTGSHGNEGQGKVSGQDQPKTTMGDASTTDNSGTSGKKKSKKASEPRTGVRQDTSHPGTPPTLPPETASDAAGTSGTSGKKPLK